MEEREQEERGTAGRGAGALLRRLRPLQRGDLPSRWKPREEVGAGGLQSQLGPSH